MVDVTIADIQVQEANRHAAGLGLADLASFELGDGLALPYPDGTYDPARVIESGSTCTGRR